MPKSEKSMILVGSGISFSVHSSHVLLNKDRELWDQKKRFSWLTEVTVRDFKHEKRNIGRIYDQNPEAFSCHLHCT